MFKKPIGEPEKLIVNVYAVYDRKAKVYAQPMLLSNDDVAIRAFSAAINPGTLLYSFPEDYVLTYLGTFDEHTGFYEDMENAHFVIEASELKGMLNEIQESVRPEDTGKEN